MQERILLSKLKAANARDASLRTLDYPISTKELPVQRVGRKLLILKPALELFVRSDHPTRSQENKNN